MKKEVRQKVYEKYGHCCAYCGCYITYKEMQVDHIKPKGRGQPESLIKLMGIETGNDSIENYNPSCRPCNFRKGMLTIEQFRDVIKKSTKILDNNFTYRFAKRHNRIAEIIAPVEFHFEIEPEKRMLLEKLVRERHEV